MDYDLDATDIAAAQVFPSAPSVPAAHVSNRMLFACMLPPHLDIQSAGEKLLATECSSAGSKC